MRSLRTTRHPLRVLLISAIVACLTATLVPSVAHAEAPGSYRPPVDVPITDSFRPPASPYGAGNRGLDYDTSPGQEVRASADGEVTYSGKIGPAWHVVILHTNGIRTSYSFLVSAALRRGDQVSQGEVVGTAGEQFHFGARAGDTYLDPATLFTNGELPVVSLIPLEQRSSQSETKERQGLLGQLGSALSSAIGATGEAMVWLKDGSLKTVQTAWTLTEWVASTGWDYAYGELMQLGMQIKIAGMYLYQFSPVGGAFYLVEQGRRAWRFQQSQKNCTPSDQPVPTHPKGRRIMLMVNGLDSKAGQGALLGLKPSDMGYGDGDIAEFSYKGGRSPGVGAMENISVNDYGSSDSQGDLRVQSNKLRDLLMEIRLANPGVPVDIVAHSEGGIMARLALGNQGDPQDPRLPKVANLITLGTPHNGSDLATMNAFLGTTTSGDIARGVADHIPGVTDTDGVAISQIAETSSLIKDLKGHPLPSGVRVTSIAAEGDVIVASLNSSLEGATNVMVPVHGPGAHKDMTKASETRKEVALALSGLGPTCRSVVAGVVLGHGVSMATDALGAASSAAAIYVDYQTGQYVNGRVNTLTNGRLKKLPLLGMPDLSNALGEVINFQRRRALMKP